MQTAGVSITGSLLGKVAMTGELDDKLLLTDAETKTLDQIIEPVNYNTYATDYFAQIYTKD